MTVQENLPLSEVLWYKLGGNAKYFITCYTKEDIFDAITFLKDKKIKKYFFCGQGSNLIFPDTGFDGAVIQIKSHTKQIEKTGERFIKAFAGEKLADVILFALDNNLTGLEWGGGLPGTVGAALRGNVGAYGGEIKDIIHSTEVILLEDMPKIQTLTNEQLRFAYRDSLIKQQKGKMIVISATFALHKASDAQTVQAKLIRERNIQNRKDKHPLEYPNCGSVFKNIREPEKIEKVIALFPEVKEKMQQKWFGKLASAYLIQKLGLQGEKIGNAQISPKHALFIVNLGNAKAQNVLDLIAKVQTSMMQTFGFYLEPEVEIVS